jgi:hypothetical protein
VAYASARVSSMAHRLDGLITNDKFCFVRRERLKLRPPRRNYVFSSGIQRGGSHETTMDDPSHSGHPKRRRTSLGSGLPAPPALGDANERGTSKGGGH